MSTCYHPECGKERACGGFCAEHYAAMWTPREERRETVETVDMTTCPCGSPAVRHGLCALHFVWAWLKPVLQRRRALRTKAIAALAILMLAFTLLACTDVGGGSCRQHTPCHSVQGANP